MSNFTKNENANWQREVRGKLEDLRETVTLTPCPWNAWELEFIEDMVGKLDHDIINISPKQYGKVWDLWEKI